MKESKLGKLWIIVTIVFFAIATASSWAKKKTVKPAQHAISDTLSENTKRRFEYFYLGAINQQTLGHLSAAYDLLGHCIEINPNAAEAYFTRGAFDVLLKKDTLALNDYEHAVTLSPDNNTYRERLAQFYIKEGKYDLATKAYEQLYDNNYNRSDVLDILVQLYNQAQNYPKMLETLNRMETEDGTSEQLTLQKMQVYDMQGDKKAAYNELHSLVQKHPYDANYRVMMGNWLMNNDRPKEALQAFNDVLKDDKDNIMAQMSMLDYYKMQHEDNLYRQLMVKLLLDKQTPDDGKITLIRQFVADNEQNGGDSSKVLNVFHQMLAQPQTSATTLKMLAAYMQVKQMPKDSINKVMREILRIEPDDAATRLQLIQSEVEKNNRKGIIEMCKPALQYNPEEMVFYYFLGISYYQEDKEDEALDVLRKGASQIKRDSNTDIASDLYAIMGDILHGKGKINEAYAAYDSCLQWKPDNYECLNNYAYFISESGKDLPKAEQMSYKTVKAEPDNSTFLDTYAWILFLEQRYEEAKIYIDQALKNEKKEAPSGVVAEHAGDIHAMTGDTDKALELWKRALELGDGVDKTLLQKKIKLKKYITK